MAGGEAADLLIKVLLLFVVVVTAGDGLVIVVNVATDRKQRRR